MTDTTRKPILILGGTGKTGRRLAERLTAKGIPVRIGSRNGTPSFDWLDKGTWGPALDGVGAVYISYYPDIAVPLLVINGDTDTLVSTQDSVDLATAVPNSELILYLDDDHCAMGHYTEWLAYSVDWLQRHLR